MLSHNSGPATTGTISPATGPLGHPERTPGQGCDDVLRRRTTSSGNLMKSDFVPTFYLPSLWDVKVHSRMPNPLVITQFMCSMVFHGSKDVIRNV